jgi:hypothetical protein
MFIYFAMSGGLTGIIPRGFWRTGMSESRIGGKGRLALGAATLALIAGFAFVVPDGMSSFAPAAWAEDDGDGDGQGGKPTDKGNQGEGQKGQDNAGKGQGQGGPGEDSDGKGPQAGGPAEDGGGKPAWAQEGIPEVELGRLSVARSPDQVLDRALAEAVGSLTPEMVAFYNLSLDEAIEELSLNFDTVTFIDSPLQNLALLEDVLSGGTAMEDAGVTTGDSVLAAMLLGAASDKTVPISTNTVIAVTTILGTPISLEAAEELARRAEDVRIAILAGHG